jgi:hypothetical protein
MYPTGEPNQYKLRIRHEIGLEQLVPSVPSQISDKIPSSPLFGCWCSLFGCLCKILLGCS